MVGIDALSQQVDAVKQLSDHHEVPICAVHAPCLLFTQRVWGTDPWGKLERSAEMAAGGRRRRGRRAPAVPVAEGLRRRLRRGHRGAGGVAPASRSRSRTCIRGGPPSRRGMEMYLPGWDPSRGAVRQHDHRPLPRRDRAQRRRSRWPSGWATRLRHIHLTDGTGSAKDEHLVPGRGVMRAEEFLRHLARTGFAGHVVLEINTRRCANREEREADLAESLEFARAHLACTTP